MSNNHFCLSLFAMLGDECSVATSNKPLNQLSNEHHTDDVTLYPFPLYMDLNLVIVEDDEDDVQLFVEAVNHAQLLITVIPVNSSEDIFSNIVGKLPDIIVLDSSAIGHSVTKVVSGIRADKRLRQIPIFMLTGYADGSKKHESIEAGIEAYFTKPSTFPELVDVVKQMYHITWLLKQSAKL